MKLRPLSSLLMVAAAALLALPAATFARDNKITVVRDRDGDGHYNKKTYDVGNRNDGRYSSNRYYGSRYSGSGYYGNRSYGSRYYGGSYGYPYYGYGYRPSVNVSYYSRPSYVSTYADDYDDDTAVDVQRALRRRGYYYGGIDGDVGPGTRAAIRSYQRDRGLPVTSRIDGRLLRSLGVS